MRRLNYGDCFIEPEDQTREKIKRIYFVKDIDKETYTTICIHLDCKGQVTERTDYKKNIKRQMRKFDTPQKYFALKPYMKWVENIFENIIPKTYTYEYCPFEVNN